MHASGKTLMTLGLVTAATLLVSFGLLSAGASHLPADKVVANGSTIEFRSVPLREGEASEEFVLLTATLRSSAPTDLLLHLSFECALWTTVTTIGNDESEATARVNAWIEIDGVAVPVSAGDEDGKVVFCDRTHRQSVEDLDDEDANITQFLRTRTANAFEWVTLNVGSGIHTVVAKAEIEAQVLGIGKRTLVVEPAKLANDAAI